eukprot:CAMPEP_0176112580 /NCGR_PEP_ID=MMETSP0120_2-20121206/56540_1 /TAXON_ID=160619 /ORGANISM="Kryptoperidinium foliaceum, Strain CCMP 1326" /LENGTH=185 /DNA_ID=CAMNT_0017446813 /DNA_START=141 /DNA_END=695 /DNA_ORIENTATION=+
MPDVLLARTHPFKYTRETGVGGTSRRRLACEDTSIRMKSVRTMLSNSAARVPTAPVAEVCASKSASRGARSPGEPFQKHPCDDGDAHTNELPMAKPLSTREKKNLEEDNDEPRGILHDEDARGRDQALEPDSGEANATSEDATYRHRELAIAVGQQGGDLAELTGGIYRGHQQDGRQRIVHDRCA